MLEGMVSEGQRTFLPMKCESHIRHQDMASIFIRHCHSWKVITPVTNNTFKVTTIIRGANNWQGGEYFPLKYKRMQSTEKWVVSIDTFAFWLDFKTTAEAAIASRSHS